METNEAKLKLLEEQLKKLTSENKELREMCLYLDRSHEDSEVKLTPPESTELLVHTRILAELNKRGGGIIPQYRGVTSQSTLKDDGRGGSKRSMRDPLHISGGVDPKVAVAEMKKRMDQLEREKLELIKVLSLETYDYTIKFLNETNFQTAYFKVLSLSKRSLSLGL